MMWWMLASALACPPSLAQPNADTTHGCLTGVADSGFEAFLGVPYAEPPVGDLRWKPPEPIAPWGRYRANQRRSVCPQSNGSILSTTLSAGDGEEDCLYLNVVRPAGAQPGDRLPILFFTHGGGHSDGSGGQELYLEYPEIVTSQNVILVTHNYRLAQLGFLAHPGLTDENAVSGNQGFLDSVAALQWVHDNADALGGDPDRLMIFGESAGSITTCAMLASPTTQGLFTTATLQSGHCGSSWRALSGPLPNPLQHSETAEEQGSRLATELGCDDPDARVELACMRSRSTAEIMSVMSARHGLRGAGEAYGPNVDGVVFPQQPIDAFRQGQFHRVPVTAGVTEDEATLFSLVSPSPQTWAAVDQQIRLWALLQGVDPAGMSALYDASRFAAPDEAHEAFVGDVVFVCPTRAMLQTISPYTETRGYIFGRTPPWIPFLGAFHGGELSYIFGTNPLISPAADVQLSNTMQAAWAWLARGTGQGPWLPFDDGAVPGGNWASFNAPSAVMTTDLRSEECGFLESQGWNPFN